MEFHPTDSDQIIAYSKREGSDLILIVVNLDPARAQGTTIHWNYFFLGLDESCFTDFEVTDLLDGKKYTWGKETFVRLDPTRPVGRVAHIAHVKLA